MGYGLGVVGCEAPAVVKVALVDEGVLGCFADDGVVGGNDELLETEG